MPVAVVLPTGHGKTTLHQSIPGIYDAGELVMSKETLRSIRRNARASGDWTEFDEYWLSEVRKHLPKDLKCLLLPSHIFAQKCGLLVAATFILPLEVIEDVITTRPKAGREETLRNRSEEESNGSNIVYARSHCDIERMLRILASSPQEFFM
jgi:ABC-type cobalamin/Fe3+-siderophores transport system ATPase subunit